MNTNGLTQPLHISVGVHPSGSVELKQEIKLVKAAMLYADKVSLFSPTASILQIVAEIGNLSDDHKLLFMEMVAPYVTSAADASRLATAIRKVRSPLFSHTAESRLHRAAFIAQLDAPWRELKETLTNIYVAAEMQELTTAAESGVIEVHRFKTQENANQVIQTMVDFIALASKKQLSAQTASAIHGRTEEMTREFVAHLCSAVASGNTYPLFDRSMGQIVSLANEAGIFKIGEVSQRRGRQVALARDLFERLPIFEHAGIEEILILRNQLDRYLVRFRSSIIKFASSMATSPWEADFEKEADEIFRSEVAPAILDLEDAIKSNNLVQQILRKSIDKPLVLTSGAALSLVLSQFANLPAQIASGIGVGIAASTLIYDAYKEWSDTNRALKRNGLYFYYELGNKPRRHS